MQKWKRRLIISGAAVISLCIIYIVFNFVFLDFFVNFWWFGSLDFQGYYLKRIFYREMTFAAVFLFFSLVFFSNFWFASRYLGTSSIARECQLDLECRKRHERMFHNFQSGSMKIYTPLSFLLAIPVSIPFYEKWEEGLLWFFGPSSGIQDPVFGKNISYYLFSYPIYSFLQQELLTVFSLLFFFLFILYALESRFLNQEEQALPKSAKIHLTAIAVIATLMGTWGILLQRVELLYKNTHLPRFFGPGFVEMWIELPLIWLTAIAFTATVFSLIYYVHKRRGLIPLLSFIGILLLLTGVRTTDFIERNIQEYFVVPNESVREKPYIERSIESTLHAFDLQDVETRNYRIHPVSELTKDVDLQKSLRNIPLWDRELLDAVFTQLQSFNRYYDFSDVDVDRYTVNGVYQQVFLAARELNTEELPEAARNWINIHLQYSHGYGIVMIPAVQGGDEPMTWFLSDMPIVSDFDFKVSQPGIYYGEQYYPYTIVPNDMGEIDRQAGKNDDAGKVHYSGTGGVSLSTIWRKILFSVYFQEQDILLTSKTNKKSRILFRRNILEAIRTVTPFFVLDEDPYIVNTSEGLFWVVDAYTVSSRFPNAQQYSRNAMNRNFDNKEFNYIRNSVKITVDAYNGNIAYYVFDPSDPIIRAYSRIYPELLRPIDRMPEEMRAHLRYPKQLFRIQMDVYAKYHQTDPEIFYREEDTWEFAKMGSRNVKPYYMTLNTLKKENTEFLLFSPMSPLGRDNLRSLVVVGCDGDDYGKIVVFSFPPGRQILGPSQINALINQDTDIAQEISLWAQTGSEVIYGRMILLPLRNTLLYIQPLYIRSATGLKIPELKRIIISQGDLAVMDRSIEGAVEKLETKLKARYDRIQKRLAPAAKETPAAAQDTGNPHTAEDSRTEEKNAENSRGHETENRSE
ncbi:MAG: UPF0182 family protein [Desulfococcaceae bacterium]|nr:UPF0182 family protein [Desulfococcaceae bacterium]